MGPEWGSEWVDQKDSDWADSWDHCSAERWGRCRESPLVPPKDVPMAVGWEVWSVGWTVTAMVRMKDFLSVAGSVVYWAAY